jgi:5-methylcytosine-specific restriction endonuclease McrA|tara:strand:+ start:150 stop:314 length:165 start_codon:yes stop_codon:yes gene_type:complete
MDLAVDLKRIIAARDGYRCRRCGIELKQDSFDRNIDHIIPRDLIAISDSLRGLF